VAPAPAWRTCARRCRSSCTRWRLCWTWCARRRARPHIPAPCHHGCLHARAQRGLRGGRLLRSAVVLPACAGAFQCPGLHGWHAAAAAAAGGQAHSAPLALRRARARQVCEQLRRLTTDLEAAMQPCLKVSTAGKVRPPRWLCRPPRPRLRIGVPARHRLQAQLGILAASCLRPNLGRAAEGDAILAQAGVSCLSGMERCLATLWGSDILWLSTARPPMTIWQRD